MSSRPLLYDRYRIVRKLGSGTFATVYLADDLRMGRPVAVKVVEDKADVDGRAIREAQAAAKLDHPHIVTIHEVVREEHRTLLFTEYVEGHTLRELFARGWLSDAEIIEAGVQICRALEHAHKRGVVHRDIKPENVMLVDTEGVDVRIMDFGVARLEDYTSITVDGDLVGTLAYMAPEQVEGGAVDAKADVYSVALTLYEGLTGTNPARGRDIGDLVRGAGRVVFPRLSRIRPDLPLSLEEALLHGLDRDAAVRQDAAGLRRLLQKAGRELPATEERPNLAERTMVALVPALSVGDRLAQFGFVGQRLVAGALSLATAAYLLPRMPFYPGQALVPLVAAGAFVSLLSPAVGGALTLVLLGLPVFAFGFGWGGVYALLAGVFWGLMFWRKLSWAALLPGAVPLLVAGGVGLVFPPLCWLLLRRWGPVAAFLGGIVIALAVGLQTLSAVPYAFTQASSATLLAARHEASPGQVAMEIARFLDLNPELFLQALLFALLGVPLVDLLPGESARRLWVASAYLSVFFLALVLLPPLLLGVPVDLVRFILAFWPCAIIVYLSALLAPVEGSAALEA